MVTHVLTAFVRSYLETALWSSNDESTPGGEPFDRHYSISDIAESTIEQAVTDCKKFQADNHFLLREARDDAQAGHDFWLTRNHHGAGFWDGDYPNNGDALTEACRPYRELCPMLGDNGQIHFE